MAANRLGTFNIARNHTLGTYSGTDSTETDEWVSLGERSRNDPWRHVRAFWRAARLIRNVANEELKVLYTETRSAALPTQRLGDPRNTIRWQPAKVLFF